jgi:hypothetical protein
MKKNSEINWLNIISIKEFQINLNLIILKKVSMVSKLAREKLKPAIFKNLKLNLDNIKFNSNIISIAYNNRIACFRQGYRLLSKENSHGIEDSLNDFIAELNDIRKYTKSFHYYLNRNAGYYLYSLVNLFDNLTELKIYSCKVPFVAFADIGKRLPNLNRIELESADLVKSTTDVIAEKDITFPPNLSYLKLCSVYITTSSLLSDPYECIMDKKVTPASFEDFVLPKVSIPTLKRLDFRFKGEGNRGLEEFLEINPNIESLLTRSYILNINSSLNSLKSIDSDYFIPLNNIDQAFRLNSINSLAFLIRSFDNFENIRRLFQICPNVTNLSIQLLGTMSEIQVMIDTHLAPAISKLYHLKTLAIINTRIDKNNEILDFTKFSQIEKLKVQLIWGSLLNIKFDGCVNLKKVELVSYVDKITDEFKKKFNHYTNWKFNFSDFTVNGHKNS